MRRSLDSPVVTTTARDCGYDEDGRWFRYRAAAIILDQGRVLMARNGRDPYYYSIGGAVHHSESAYDAVRREVLEETGVTMDVSRLAFIHENFFRDSTSPVLAGRECHELAFYLLMAYDPAVPLGTRPSVTADGVQEWHEWVPLDRYGVDAVMHPAFLADRLARLRPVPEWVTTRE